MPSLNSWIPSYAKYKDKTPSKTLDALKNVPTGISLVILFKPKYTPIKASAPTIAPVKTGTVL